MRIKQMKKLIVRYKKQLSNNAISENFGQKELRKLREFMGFVYPEDRELVYLYKEFEAWCMDYEG
jgi:hypothetical protein